MAADQKNNQHRFTASVNGDYSFSLEVNKNESVSVHRTGNEVHVVADGTSYSFRLDSIDRDAGIVTLYSASKRYTVQISDDFDELLERMGFNDNAGNEDKDIKAPMPGLVLDVMVAEGEEVSKGAALLILEAMKMENIIQAPFDGIVEKVHIRKTDSVPKGNLLITLTPTNS